MEEPLNLGDMNLRFYWGFLGPNFAPIQLEPRIGSFKFDSISFTMNEDGSIDFNSESLELREVDLENNLEDAEVLRDFY